MKRLLAVLVGAGLAVGGGVAAWAQTSGGSDGTTRAAAKACLQQAKAADSTADKATLKAAVKDCLAAQGITVGQKHQLTPEQQAKRDALKSCLQGVKAANPNATRAELRAAAKPCLDQAGISADKIRPKIAALKTCIAQAKADNPGATRADLAAAVKTCVQNALNAS